jgi:hypothetical protein
LCLRYRSTTSVSKTMTRSELQAATGLSAETLIDTLKILRRPKADQDLQVPFIDADAETITLGLSWIQDCGASS